MELVKKSKWLPVVGLALMAPFCLVYLAMSVIEESLWPLAGVSMYGGLSIYWLALLRENSRLANIGMLLAAPGMALMAWDLAMDIF